MELIIIGRVEANGNFRIHHVQFGVRPGHKMDEASPAFKENTRIRIGDHGGGSGGDCVFDADNNEWCP